MQNAIGMVVTHKSYGEGLVTDYNGEHITVEFTNRSSAFQMPQAFEKGFLQSEYFP